jgi:hypothetical protein
MTNRGVGEMDIIDRLIKGYLRKESKMRQKTKCLDEEILAAFYDGKLDEGLEKQVREHLLSCDKCIELAAAIVPQFDEKDIEEKVKVPLRSLNRVMRLDPAREGAWEVMVSFARDVVQSIKTGGDVSVTSPVPAEAFRGGPQVISESLVAFKKEFPPFFAEIEVEKVKDDKGEITVSVSEKETGQPARGLRVSLFDPKKELESYVLDHGRAVFENIKFGKYLLHLTKKGKEIGKISLNMKT